MNKNLEIPIFKIPNSKTNFAVHWDLEFLYLEFKKVMKPQKAAHYKQPFAFYSVLKKIVIKKKQK